LPRIPGFSLAADWRSALEMAGDFYDIFALPDGRWGIIVADVSDKGAAAALYMAMTRSLVRASASAHSSPAAALTEVNGLFASPGPTCSVSSHGILDTGPRPSYLTPGHNPVARRFLAAPSTYLGVLGIFEEHRFTIPRSPAGRAPIIYTDGVTI
jgi:sigma-B regulation protein RsbU (phosphoserine phosphatase)